MPIVRCEVTSFTNDELPADYITNVVYHDVAEGVLTGGADYDNHADGVLQAFIGGTSDDATFDLLAARQVDVKAYNMSDGLPRPVRGSAHSHPTNSVTMDSFGPQQIALCLSYYAEGRNIAGQRGHLYIGPFSTSVLLARPADGIIGKVKDLGNGLFNVGGDNVHWVLHHQGRQTSAKGVKPATYGTTESGHPAGSTQIIHDWWVDNSWDIIRRRKVKATKRVTGHGG